ncbi:MAG: N-acetylglucosamine-6-phosphate deacetylase [Planctomycetaceae bacterium]|uniref:N-acetylglucosamine-6-phosphate deacetylase n=1 Tax=Lacipirellula limnantheis TaxID=2528024 RepID=A0A517U0N9_9BACT|nr:N-acetylglucosamine-6-phosphate deacetylase [Lacipirellula limnantheis]MBL9162521.1 N-acetylglucosamine-6-phosphate deacetylase [Planctomycetaceae bacterium]QDT74198.1 N-acetylglucosamine-6-phosphate deacetylase [Lacipirellula limnantheis]
MPTHHTLDDQLTTPMNSPASQHADDHGFVDLQVNGYAGVDFNGDQLAADDLETACQAMRADGVARFLATIITDDLDVMAARARRIANSMVGERLASSMVAGIHFEGPFISHEPGYVGAHPAQATRAATVDAAAKLLDAGGGLVRLVTLAPEQDADGRVTAWLADRGVVVSAGHCNPTLEQLARSIDAGLSMFTHLGNGCPLTMHRHDNIIQRALSLADKLWVCFIADGVHIPFVALQNYLRLVGPERAIVVSDAISAAGKGPGVYRLAGQEVVVDDQLATWAADRSHLVGSACTLRQMADNLRTKLALPADVIRRLTTENPLAALP